MAKTAEAFLGKPLPRWVRIAGCLFGIVMLSVGMSSLLIRGGARETVVPMFTGSLLVYVSGFEKKLRIDDAGVTRTASFWGHKNIQCVPWEQITDVRVVLNKGRRLYVLAHGPKKVWPLTFLLSQREEVLDVLREHLEPSAINVEL